VTTYPGETLGDIYRYRDGTSWSRVTHGEEPVAARPWRRETVAARRRRPDGARPVPASSTASRCSGERDRTRTSSSGNGAPQSGWVNSDRGAVGEHETLAPTRSTRASTGAYLAGLGHAATLRGSAGGLITAPSCARLSQEFVSRRVQTTRRWATPLCFADVIASATRRLNTHAATRSRPRCARHQRAGGEPSLVSPYVVANRMVQRTEP